MMHLSIEKFPHQSDMSPPVTAKSLSNGYPIDSVESPHAHSALDGTIIAFRPIEQVSDSRHMG